MSRNPWIVEVVVAQPEGGEASSCLELPDEFTARRLAQIAALLSVTRGVRVRPVDTSPVAA